MYYLRPFVALLFCKDLETVKKTGKSCNNNKKNKKEQLHIC